MHQAIESQIAQHSLGRPVSKAAAKSLLEFQLGRMQENPEAFLVEEVNGTEYPTDLFETVAREGEDLLDSFFDIVWPPFETLTYEQHEKLERFPLVDINVYLKVDLVSRMNDGTVIITDWKTSKLSRLEKEHKRQLLVYVLWAMERYDVNYTQVTAEVIPLPFPGEHLVHKDWREREVEEFKGFILDNARAMLAIESEEEFPASPSENLCRQCNFATICPEGGIYLPKGRLAAQPLLPGKIASA